MLEPALCLTQIEGRSQKRIFETVSEKITAEHPSLDYAEVFDAFSSRERLGSTGLGHGVAIPHCRIEQEGGSIAAAVTLDQPIEFDAPDQKPVDILVFLMVCGDASQTHLDTLATLSRLLSEESNRRKLREAENDDALHNILVTAAG